jgi:hemerythrin-like domain-containing protein
MKRSGQDHRGSGQLPTDPGLLARPLDFICEDHFRERQICAEIERLAAAASFDRASGMAVLRFLNEEVGVHLRDEAEDLFPILLKRCTDEDAIETALARIRHDRNEALSLLPGVRGALVACLDSGAALSAADRATLTRFAAHVRRHLVAENAILLPIARARLTRGDLRRLSDRMRLRRGLPPVPGASHAE